MRPFLVSLSCALVLSASVFFACGGDEERSSPGASGGTSSGDPLRADGSSKEEDPVEVTEETIEFGGNTRHYFLAIPKKRSDSRRYPLVLSFHGNPGTAQGMAEGLPFHSVSKADAVIAYPDALSDDWDLYTPTDSNADMHFVEALVGEIKDKVKIDESKVFGFGYSGGSFFITQMACRFPGFFRAIAVNAGGGPDEEQMGYDKHPNGCWVCPGGPVATLVTHGLEDTEVVPESGEFTATCYSVTNGCGEELTDTDPEPCQAYQGCPDETPVKRCMIPGLGHGIWGDAMKEAWAFFRSLP